MTGSHSVYILSRMSKIYPELGKSVGEERRLCGVGRSLRLGGGGRRGAAPRAPRTRRRVDAELGQRHFVAARRRRRQDAVLVHPEHQQHSNLEIKWVNS